MTPKPSLPPMSKARAGNCCLAPASIAADDGETSTRATTGQGVNGVAFSRVPELKGLPPPALADWCKTKLPVTSGERVKDWLAPPLRPVDPPYAKTVTAAAVLSRRVMTPPVLLS